jgi:hypothetical protein
MHMLDKLLELLNASTKVGFALVFAGAAFLLGRAYGLWAVALPEHQLAYVIYAMLLGAGFLIARFLLLCWVITRFAGLKLRIWLNAWTVMNRIGELNRREQLALYWIAHHKDETISGSRYTDPFNRLCAKGYLIATDNTGAVQGFKVNPRVYSQKKKLLKFVPEQYHHLSGNFDHPW